MESLQRETEDLLDDSPMRSRTRGLGRLRRGGQRAETPAVSRPPITTIAESLLSGFEQELTKRLGVLLRRIDVPSREEIERLAERVAALEAQGPGVVSRHRRAKRSEPRGRRRIAKS
jgi:hypothetical protein